MTTTVIVAIITSVSTLCGGAIASLTSIAINRHKSDDERITRRREIRRDAYVQLLNEFDKTVSQLDGFWMIDLEADSGPATAQAATTVTSLDSLETAMNVVKLEGPSIIIDAAQKAYDTLNEEFAVLLDIIMVNSRDEKYVGKSSLTSFKDTYYDRKDSRRVAKKLFIEKAKDILELEPDI